MKSRVQNNYATEYEGTEIKKITAFIFILFSKSFIVLYLLKLESWKEVCSTFILILNYGTVQIVRLQFFQHS